jgi:hypothetical protein
LESFLFFFSFAFHLHLGPQQLVTALQRTQTTSYFWEKHP